MPETDQAKARPPADRAGGGRRGGGRAGELAPARRGVASFGSGDQPRVADALRSFVRRHGWRAYAVPILAVVTVVTLLSTRSGGSAPPRPSARANVSREPVDPQPTISTPPVAAGEMPLKSDAPRGGKAYDAALAVGALPAGAPYTKRGEGSFRVLPVAAGASKVVGHSASGQVFRYDVEIERGITGVNIGQYATLVQRVLSDSRSWSGHGVALRRVDAGRVDFHVSLTSSLTVRRYCGYAVPVETSCYATPGGGSGVDVNRVVLNVARWVRGAAPYVGDLLAYRIYMINHETGHALGHDHAHECLPGGLAPVMMQQTYGLKSAVNGRLCQANPWPYPPHTKGAPGAEQPDTPQNDEYTLFRDGD